MESERSLAGRKLQQVALTCRDLERSKAFHRDGMRLMVGKEMTPNAPIGGSVIYFDAPDIDALGPALEARGVQFPGPAQVVQRTESHELKLREFRDPDGNALALMGLVPIKSS